ncbi:MAG TPA: flagellar assembly protein FliW [Acidimicrobiales bacterium]|nr:flagellar assembly protein FliW [Acidimicrobiales bacterium]
MTTTAMTPNGSLATSSSLKFSAGIPGFAGARTFSMKPWGEEPTPFYVLECREVPGLRFVVMRPALFFPWYKPRFGSDVCAALDVDGQEALNVLVILTLGPKPELTTANLLGPLVVNPLTNMALQAVLSGSGYDPQAPLIVHS